MVGWSSICKHPGGRRRAVAAWAAALTLAVSPGSPGLAGPADAAYGADGVSQAFRAGGPKRAVVLYGLGGGGSAGPGNRTWNRGAGKGGYATVFNQMRRDADLGVREFILHLPGSRTMMPDGTAERPMDFDGFVEVREAYEAGQIDPWVRLHPRDFTAELAAFLLERPGVRVGVYLGSLAGDPDMIACQPGTQRWHRRVYESLEPVLAVCRSGAIRPQRITIYFDALGAPGAVAEGDPALEWMRALARNGFRIGMEPHPPDDAPFLFGYDAITSRLHWDMANTKFRTRDRLRGDLYLMVKELPSSTRQRDEIAELIDHERATAIVIRPEQAEWVLPMIEAHNAKLMAYD